MTENWLIFALAALWVLIQITRMILAHRKATARARTGGGTT